MKIAHHYQSKQGFTLIEILVVISIIGILSGMLFTGASAAMRSAKKADASNTAYNVRNAASAYFTEYRRQAKPEGTSGSGFADFPSDQNYMDMLMGADSDIGRRKNPRGIAFFTGKAAKRFTGGTFIGGVNLNQNGGGSLWDPFGRMYGIRLDISNKGRMDNPVVRVPSVSGGEGAPEWGRAGSVANAPNLITESVVVWSAGPDLQLAKDNVLTW